MITLFIRMGQGNSRDLPPQKIAQFFKAVAVFPAYFEKVPVTVLEVGANVVVVPPIQLQVFLLVAVGKIIAVRKLAAMLQGWRPQRMALEAVEPYILILPDCKDKPAPGIHPIEVFIDQRPGPVLEEVEALDRLSDTGKIVSQDYIFKKTPVAFRVTIPQDLAASAQGGGPGLIETNAEYL
ncbi:MAG: hypothetical protein WBN83_09420 [Desulfoprunum sp.]|jgi:hypothetical protein|nr:hypothetical protein JT06_07925 [Desulfobulbus sp. Tol-SR]